MMKQYRDLIYLLIVITLAFILFYKQPFQENLTLPVGGNITIDGKSQYIPKGAIIAYYPKNGNITADPPPAGWSICDGRNGTPDLRGRFLRMYSNDIGDFTSWGGREVSSKSGLGYDAGLAGRKRDNTNSWIFKHNLGDFAGTDASELSVIELPPHNHGTFGPSSNCWRGGSCGGGDYLVSGGNNRQTGNTGSGWGHNNQPPYFVIVYIMKM